MRVSGSNPARSSSAEEKENYFANREIINSCTERIRIPADDNISVLVDNDSERLVLIIRRTIVTTHPRLSRDQRYAAALRRIGLNGGDHQGRGRSGQPWKAIG